MQAFADVLKVFIEKHLIPTVLAFVFAFLAYVFLPADFLGRNKYDAAWFIVFAWAATFIVIQLIMNIGRFIKGRISSIKNTISHNSYVEERNEDTLQQVWTIVDGYSCYDKDMIKEFIRNGNKPIVHNGYDMGISLCHSSFVHASEVTVSEPRTIVTKDIKDGILSGYISSQKKQYVLTRDFYEILKYGYEKYGRISHFD